jgi:cytochrome c-type biogenesis protein CcmH/NrfG
MSSTPGADAPLKYTKESFLGVRDAWFSFAAARFSKAAAMFEQMADKLPPAVKSKLPKSIASKPTTGANAPS